MSDKPEHPDLASSPMPTPATPTQEQLPSHPAPHLPAPGALEQGFLTGLNTKETLEAKQKAEGERKRAENIARHSRVKTPPQPRRPGKQQAQPQSPQPASDVPHSPPPVAENPSMPPSLSQMMMPIGMAAPTMGNPTVQAMVMQMFNQTKFPGQGFHMVVLPEDAWPRVETFETVEKLITGIRSYLGTPTHVFPFIGQLLGITAGPNHHLRTPYGMLPLFDIPTADEAEEVEYGWLGPNLHRPEAPQMGDEEVVNMAADEAEEEQVERSHMLTTPAVDQTPIFGTGDNG